ncbi:MAG: response regulator transcription factor [Chloroflexi bacterium]|nr:response regulator transcription factor [Chloroflexota bacterium]
MLIRELLASALEQAGFLVVGQTGDELTLRRLVEQHKPHIVVLDWEVSEDRVAAVRGLTEYVPNAIVVVLTRPQPSELLTLAIRERVKGYLSVNLSTGEFVESLRMLTKGDVVISRDMMDGMQQGLATAEPKPLDRLSNREREVLVLICRGATNREIAEWLTVSQHTAKVHVRNILNKLNLRNRQQAAAYAMQQRLVKDVKSEDSS